MTDVIHHRGPDDGGVFVRGPIALGMRLLSIIDLEGGRQPFSNDTGRLQRRDLDRGDWLRDSHLGLHARCCGRDSRRSNPKEVLHGCSRVPGHKNGALSPLGHGNSCKNRRMGLLLWRKAEHRAGRIGHRLLRTMLL
jgi:hypothetical protein